MAIKNPLAKAVSAAVFGVAISGASMGTWAESSAQDDLLHMKSDANVENRSADKAAIYSEQHDQQDNMADSQSSMDSDQSSYSTDEYQSSQYNQQSQTADVSMDKTLHFQFDSTDLTEQGKQKLEQIKSELEGKEGTAKVSITGYTDTSGPEVYNEYLSEERAKAIKNELQAVGIEVTDWEVKGRGEANPIADNDSRQGRQENRRVELSISSDSQDAVSSAASF